MTQALPKLVNFEEFVEWLPEKAAVRYELHNRNIIEIIQPVGEHQEVTGFLTIAIAVQINHLGLPYSIPNKAIVRPPEKDSGYFPDVLVVNRANLVNETLWQKQSVLSLGASIPLVIEVVSTNRRDDYYLKYADYEEMGIPEYWIVDYAALGGRNFIGNPKQPTISVCNLVDGEYQILKFRDNDRIVSQTFLDLNLTANQIFQAGLV